MLTPYVDSSVGLGVFIQNKENRKFFSHGGADEGFRANYFGSFEGGFGAIVMVNSDNGAIIGEIMNSISKVYGWPEPFPVNKKKVVNLSVDSISLFAGTYYFDDGDSAVAIQKNNELLFALDNDSPGKAWFSSNRAFFSFIYPYEMNFANDEKGEIVLHVRAGKLHVAKRRK